MGFAGSSLLLVMEVVATDVTASQSLRSAEQMRPLGEDYSPVPHTPPPRCLPPRGSPTPANSSPLLLQGCLVQVGDLAGQSVKE